jgi:hypothetical protein
MPGVYLGYHPGMSRAIHSSSALAAARLLALACVLPCACASKFPDVAPLCGTWSDGSMTEHWWIEGKGLRGEGQTLDDTGQVQSTELLELAASRRGHVYVARPGGQAPTEFAPIDPAESRFPRTAPAAAKTWVWANYEHDYPQEIHYTLVDDHLHAEIIGPGDDTGQSLGRAMGWTLQRTAACSEEHK